MKKKYIKISGILNLLTAFLHLIAGQIDLVQPLLNGNLEIQQKAELVGAWHIVTILLFMTSYLILKAGFGKLEKDHIPQLKSVSLLYILSGIPFIVVSIWLGILAPQWILLMPIGILLHLGLREEKQIYQ